MHVLVLPSWFPCRRHPAGLFIYDQIMSLSNIKELKLSVLDWGPNEYVLKLRNPVQSVKNIINYNSDIKRIEKKKDNLTIFSIPHLTWSSYLLKGNYDALIPKATEFVKDIEAHSGKIDLIHAHVTFPAGYLAMHLSQKLSIPFIITEHSGPFPFKEYRTSSGIRGIITKPLNASAKIIAVSSWLAQSIKKYSVHEPIIIPNSGDIDFFKPLPTAIQSSIVPNIFTLSKITEGKGIGDYLEALRILKHKGVRLDVRIGGSGTGFARFRKLSLRMGLDDCVTWLGNLNRADALSEYQKCDFYVMPSRLESLSMVILEATACGKPIVATDCGGPKDLIDKDQGFLVEPENPQALANGIEIMLNTYPSYDSNTIRANCIKKFSPEAINQRICEVYKEVIDYYTNYRNSK